ncbi:MAG: F0F1 ATP synthase subunit B [Anaerolineae bacterium]|nr:F0F1 ATP synthase subunit B [Anaerolineae bacterium]
MGDALGALGINVGLLVSQIVNLLLMVVLLYAIAYKPILSMLEKRRERVAEGINKSREAENRLAEAEQESQKILDEARNEAKSMTDDALVQADRLRERVKQSAEADAELVRKEAQEAVEAQQKAFQVSMRDQVVALSIAAANHLIDSSLDTRKQKALIKEFFTAIPDEAKALTGSLEVITAVHLTESEQKKYGAMLNSETIHFVVEPSILGGVIVRTESGEQVNASYAKQLSQLRASLS